MTDLFAEYFTGSDPGILTAAAASVCFLFWYILKNQKTIQKFIDRLYDRRKTKEELLKAIRENQAEIKQLVENRLNDRRQSLLVQKELTESISSISRKIDDMQKNTDQRFYESEQKNNKRIRAELKDKISQSYRYYHSSGKINDMELEALEDLIEEYESADGKNSFVHTVVQKEMYTWEKDDKIKKELFFENSMK